MRVVVVVTVVGAAVVVTVCDEVTVVGLDPTPTAPRETVSGTSKAAATAQMPTRA